MDQRKLTERERIRTQIEVLIAELDSPACYLSNEDRREIRTEVKSLQKKLETRR